MKSILLLFCCFVIYSCVESFQADFESFESYLVVEATITDELKNQEVKLSRTFNLDEHGPNPETEASVIITTSTGIEYVFIEQENGVYLSNEQFQVLPELTYQLNIKTSDGNVYKSFRVTSPPTAEITDLYAERSFDEFDNLGLTFFVDSQSESEAALFLRYEYEETYKIAAPFWHPLDVQSVRLNEELFYDEELSGPLYIVSYEDRSETEKECFKTLVNTEIIITNTAIFNGNKLLHFPINFEVGKSISLAERYSILVRQYVQTAEANAFYETLRSFSESGNLFSQIQTGFIEGNIQSTNNENDKVIGFFDISTIETKRIFLNREDFFNESDQIFEYECNPVVPEKKEAEEQIDFINRLNGSLFLYKFFAFDKEGKDSLFQLVERECGDCTALGSGQKPDFWID